MVIRLISPAKKLLVLLLVCPQLLWAASLTLESDRSDIGINDSINFRLQLSDAASDGEPDLSPLSQYFQILQQSRQQQSSMQMSVINGKPKTVSKKTITVNIEAIAKEAGEHTIAPIKWGKYASQALVIKVNPVASGTQNMGDFFVKSELETTTPLVQQQFILTLRAYSKNVFAAGDFSFQTPEHLRALKIPESNSIYKSAIAGDNYFVQQQRYLISAEHSGKYQLPEVLFSANFATNQRDMFGRTYYETRRVRAAGTPIEVQAIPKEAGNPWLPASAVQLSAYIAEGEHKSGEPITINLSSIAEGVMAEQLPDLQLKLPSDVKVYNDQPKLKSNWDKDKLVATRNDKIAIIPLKTGKLTIPAIELQWWNTKSQRKEVARTKAQTINIIAGSSSVAPLPPTATSAAKVAAPSTAPAAPTGVSKWWRMASWLLLALLLVCMAVIYRLWQHPRRAARFTKPKAPSMAKLLNSLDDAKPKFAAQQLISWAQQQFGSHINSLGQLQQQIQNQSQQQPSSSELALIEAIVELNKELYSPKPSHAWRSSALIKALQRYQPPPAAAPASSMHLYPNN